MAITRDENGRIYIDPDLSFCQERKYKYSLNFMGPVEKFRDVPLDKCDKTTGHGPREYVNVFNFLENAREEAESHDR